MARFWKAVNDVLRLSDIIIEVVDARFPEMSRNLEVESKVRRSGKTLIVVLNKADLISDEHFKRLKHNYKDAILVSSKKNLGTTMLRRRIHASVKGAQNLVGVVGYPNTGKSSLINVLAQKKAAGISAKAGFTKGMQKVRISKGLYLYDSPGVIQYQEQDEVKHAMIGSIDTTKIKDPDIPAMKIIEYLQKENPAAIETVYGVSPELDCDEILERIGEKLNLYKKGRMVDVERTARRILVDWQKGLIKG